MHSSDEDDDEDDEEHYGGELVSVLSCFGVVLTRPCPIFWPLAQPQNQIRTRASSFWPFRHYTIPSSARDRAVVGVMVCCRDPSMLQDVSKLANATATATASYNDRFGCIVLCD